MLLFEGWFGGIVNFLQLLSHYAGGKVASSGKRMFFNHTIQVLTVRNLASMLLNAKGWGYGRAPPMLAIEIIV